MADETEVPRLVDESLDRSLRIFTGLARTRSRHRARARAARDRANARRARVLLDRRLVAWDALERFLARGPADLTAARGLPPRRDVAARRAARRAGRAGRVPGRRPGPASALPAAPARDSAGISATPIRDAAATRRSAALLDRVAAHFLTAKASRGRAARSIPTSADRLPAPDACEAAPQRRLPDRAAHRARRVRRSAATSTRARARHPADVRDRARRSTGWRSRSDRSSTSRTCSSARSTCCARWTSSRRAASGSRRATTTCWSTSSRTPAARSGSWSRCWFSRGAKGSGSPRRPSIFIVGDRKQSIYRFRDAEVAVLQRGRALHRSAAPGGQPAAIDHAQLPRGAGAARVRQRRVRRDGRSPAARPDDFTYGESGSLSAVRSVRAIERRGPVLGLAVADDPDACAAAGGGRDRANPAAKTACATGRPACARQARPGDIAILFRSRASHREFEHALERRGIPTYVYKGLGFFDADEIKDLTALIRYLANPSRTCGRPRSCARGSSGCRIAGLALLAPELAPRSIAPIHPRPSPRSTTKIGACSSRPASSCPRLAGAGRPRAAGRSHRADPARDRVRVRAARPARASRRGRT